MCKKRAPIEFQGIGVDYFKPLMTDVCAQKICEARVFFDRENARAFLKNERSQRASSGPNFDHVIVRSDLRLIHNPASKILVVKKILAKGFGWRKGYVSKRGSYVGELHMNFACRALCR